MRTFICTIVYLISEYRISLFLMIMVLDLTIIGDLSSKAKKMISFSSLEGAQALKTLETQVQEIELLID